MTNENIIEKFPIGARVYMPHTRRLGKVLDYWVVVQLEKIDTTFQFSTQEIKDGKLVLATDETIEHNGKKYNKEEFEAAIAGLEEIEPVEPVEPAEKPEVDDTHIVAYEGKRYKAGPTLTAQEASGGFGKLVMVRPDADILGIFGAQLRGKFGTIYEGDQYCPSVKFDDGQKRLVSYFHLCWPIEIKH